MIHINWLTSLVKANERAVLRNPIFVGEPRVLVGVLLGFCDYENIHTRLTLTGNANLRYSLHDDDTLMGFFTHGANSHA